MSYSVVSLSVGSKACKNYKVLCVYLKVTEHVCGKFISEYKIKQVFSIFDQWELLTEQNWLEKPEPYRDLPGGTSF